MSDKASKLKSLILNSDFVAKAGIEVTETRVKVRNPHKTEWFRTHTDPAFSAAYALFENRDGDGEVYFVTPEIYASIEEYCVPATLYTAVNREAEVFLLIAKVPKAGGKDNHSWEATRKAVVAAQEKWTNVAWSETRKTRIVRTSTAYTEQPQWGNRTFEELLESATEGRIIDSADHPIVKGLLGTG
jgi:hypothetical protein